MAVTLPTAMLDRYTQFTLYNSPYTAHDAGHAVDLYPETTTAPDPRHGDPVPAPSPVAGTILEVRRVRAPSRPYAADDDYLLLVDTDGWGGAAPAGSRESPIARVLHVDPVVEPGDHVSVGDNLGTLVRAGFFAPWVANHLHLGFRPREADPLRASGSLPLALDPALALEPVDWDGTGTVVAAGDTYAVLDRPAHPGPGTFAGLAATVDGAGGTTGDAGDIAVLDGGLPHYAGGGLLGMRGDRAPAGTVRLLDTAVGSADGRTVHWRDLTVLANGDPVRGIALAPARQRVGVKLVGEHELAVGTTVAVEVRVAPHAGSDSNADSDSDSDSDSGAGSGD